MIAYPFKSNFAAPTTECFRADATRRAILAASVLGAGMAAATSPGHCHVNW